MASFQRPVTLARRLARQSIRSQCTPEQKSKRLVIQPDYQLWKQLAVGMTFNDVASLLGKPIKTQEGEGNAVGAGRFVTTNWYFGVIALDSPQFPKPFWFTVVFFNGRLQSALAPFKNFSIQGEPSTPTWVIPADRALVSANTNTLDLRWEPASGDYPMHYEVEAALATGLVTPDYAVYFRGETDMPYMCVERPAPRGRWRVRGVNSKGPGDWTEYSTFSSEL